MCDQKLLSFLDMEFHPTLAVFNHFHFKFHLNFFFFFCPPPPLPKTEEKKKEKKKEKEKRISNLLLKLFWKMKESVQILYKSNT